MRPSRLLLGALAVLGLVLPVGLPTAAAGDTNVGGTPAGVMASRDDGNDRQSDDRPGDDATGSSDGAGQRHDDVLENETRSGTAVGMQWFSRSLEDIALAMRARAGMPTTEAMPQSASGNLRTIRVDREPRDPGYDVMTVRVQVERGLPVDGRAFGRFVMRTLNDERGWGHDDSVRFLRTDSAHAEISVVLASPDLTDELCVPLDTGGEYSCGRNGRAVLNAVRWSEGAESFLDGGGNITEYRQYLVNHEVGHLLGYPHRGCPKDEEIAPIMVQQSISLDGCAPNAWPADAH